MASRRKRGPVALSDVSAINGRRENVRQFGDVPKLE
jgi:hypothetical protein